MLQLPSEKVWYNQRHCSNLPTNIATIAAEDASPVAAKKSKPTKDDTRSKKAEADRSTETKPTKSARSKKVSEKVEEEANGEDEDAQPPDDEQDNAQALAKIIDSDDEDEAVVDADVTFQEGQDVGEIPQTFKKLLKSSKSEDDERGVVYVGRLPRESTQPHSGNKPQH